MSWLNVLIPFATGFAKGFIREFNAPPRAAPAATIVDSGGALGWQWVAVPKAQARAFRAEYPGFYRIVHFLKTMDELQRKQPADFRTLQPLVNQVCDAVEAYDDSCELFIRRSNR